MAQVSVSTSPTTIAVTGTSQIRVTRSPQMASPSQVLISIGVQARSTETDRLLALKALQEKVVAVQQAIVQTGVPAANIQVRSYNVFSPSEGIRYPMVSSSASTREGNTSPVPARPILPPPPPAFILSQNLEVRASVDRLNAITQAAIGAGASSVNITSNPFSQSPTTQPDLPDTTAYAEAVRKATEQAQTAAQASAQGSGLKLGSVRSISVQSPAYSFNSPEGGYWRIQVNVVYNVAPQ
jgi:uncharacterized protein YggE